jgi:hypothetical protein
MKNALAIARKVAAYVGAAIVAHPRVATAVALVLGLIVGCATR